MPYRDFSLRATQACDYDIMAITESWLVPSDDKNSEFMDPKYQVFRKDRQNSTDVVQKVGGGVLIAVLNCFESEEFILPEMTSLECICVRIKLTTSFIYVYCLYIQPDATLEMYMKHMNAISKLKIPLNDTLIILGDFNLPKVKWEYNDENFDYIPIIGESQSQKAIIAREVTDFMFNEGFSQIVNYENAANNVLDLIYVNSPELFYTEKADYTITPFEKLDKAHVPMVCYANCELPKITTPTDSNHILCFRKANYDEIRNELSTIDWHSALHGDDPNELTYIFYDILHDIINKFVPRVRPRSSNQPPWYNKQLCNLRNIMKRQRGNLSRARILNPYSDDTNYMASKAEFESMDKTLFDEYVSNMAASSKQNPRVFWRFINGKRKSDNLPAKLHYDGNTLMNDTQKEYEYFT